MRGQAIWYARPQTTPLLEPAIRANATAALRKKLRAKLGIQSLDGPNGQDEDRCESMGMKEARSYIILPLQLGSIARIGS